MRPRPLRIFGTLPDGREVHRVTLCGGGLSAEILTLGAIVQALWMEDIPYPLVLGSPDLTAYLERGRYVGALVGRFANRIGDGRLVLDGTEYRTDRNFRSRHTLHGGVDGLDLQIWQIAALAVDRITLRTELPDGHMGFPGNLRVTAQIALAEDAISFALLAQTDRPTPCNLAHHGYFDLDGAGDIRDHRLRIAAEHYLPVDDDLIPTGKIASVAGTPFDFRLSRTIGDAGYDHNFCLSDGPHPIRPVALLTGKKGLCLRVDTTACGLQVYDGACIQEIAGLEGRRYGPHSGVALEAQSWPDSPNRPDFPDAILRPGRIWGQTTRYHLIRR